MQLIVHSLTPPVTEHVLVSERGQIISYSRGELLRALDVEGNIRIQLEDYEKIPEGELYAHFNLSKIEHRVCARYALPKILKSGFYNAETGETQPPVLSYENVYFGTCIDVRGGISYEEITPELFEHSMTHIKTIEELKCAMVERYTRSRIVMTREDILAVPVTWTLLRLEPRNA